jgi:DNA-binding transcriptional MerR regulator
VTDPELVSTAELARRLALSISSIKRYVAAGQITPEITTPGGHYRWNVESVRRQLRDLAQRRQREQDGN